LTDCAYSQFTGLAYDAVGNTTSLTANFGVQQSLKAIVPMAPGLSFYNGTTTYQYNKTAQQDTAAYGPLRREQTSRFTSGYTKTYTYDGAFNPVTLRSSSTLPYNGDNQRTGPETYIYDGNGNQTTYKGVEVTFDYENHLTRYGGTTQIFSAYNALGLRVKKTVGSTVTWYLYDGAVPVLELNNDGTVKAINTFGPNGLISRRTNNATSFYTFDPLGNAANVISASGTVLYNCGYDAYGQPYGNATTLTYGYGAQYGYYRDSEAATADNLLLCTYRWYDPGTARPPASDLYSPSRIISMTGSRTARAKAR
jgi:hypothetical protein